MGLRPDRREVERTEVSARRLGLAVTNFIKVGGLVLAMHEGLFVNPLRPGVLGVSAFMMAGAQGIETLLDRLLGK